MAGSYAALLSLKNTIVTLQNHPNPPISLDHQQAQSLVQKATFLAEFLELYSHREEYPTERLESRIRDAAQTGEEVIESYIVDQIQGSSTSHVDGDARGDRFRRDLHKVIDEMDVFMHEVVEIKEKPTDEDHQLVNVMSDLSLASPSLRRKVTAVEGLDDLLIELLDKLTGRPKSCRQIILITGMGGIGKTTLSAKVYEHALVVEYFDKHVWVTISQKFDTWKLMQEIVCQTTQLNKEDFEDLSEDQIGERIYKSLCGMRYLIVMDDVWSTDAWDCIQCFFPKNIESRMVITTRVSSMENELSNSITIPVDLLDEDESWKVFCKTVFGDNGCPLELEQVGKTIARNCKGLPLSIVVIGGFLAKSEQTRQDWEYVASNLSSIMDLEDNEHCLKILDPSYRQLPIHLKSCFLFVGLVYPEDAKIHTAMLVNLLVAEGFLKPIGDAIMEDVAHKYIQDLVSRNLISRRGKFVRIHDLLRDLCLKKAEKDNFFFIIGEDSNETQCGMDAMQRRPGWTLNNSQAYKAFESAPHVRRLTVYKFRKSGQVLTSRLPRGVLVKTYDDANFTVKEGCSSRADDVHLQISKFYNARFLAFCDTPRTINLSSMSLIWNLLTLHIVFCDAKPMRLSELWQMPQLKTVWIYGSPFELPSPPNSPILWSLQSLAWVKNFKCSEDVVKRIPNVQHLCIQYPDCVTSYLDFGLNRLECLRKLEFLHLNCSSYKPETSHERNFFSLPQSLQKLRLLGKGFDWEDVSAKIGSLQHLNSLHLIEISGSKWTTIEGQFLCLKYLHIIQCQDLKHWTTECTHFPVLTTLEVTEIDQLEGIPVEIGEISDT